ncbi:hypothetical protein C2S51_015695 [Perilla frutescens var. frutescens]|nr:hypothetical protein C2S51_015695 [Perilla frutescens var. frutescens]
MKLRLIRRYEVPTFGNRENISSLECVFHDLENQAMLSEGSIYALKDFMLADNNLKFKTSVETIDEGHLFDIIGRVVSRCSLQTKDLAGRGTKLIDIVIEDFNHVRLSCTLWGVYADELVSFWIRNQMRLLSLFYNFVVLKPTKSGTFWVFGRIISIEAMGAWTYLSCDKCGSKFYGVGDKFTCQKCNLDEVSGQLRRCPIQSKYRKGQLHDQELRDSRRVSVDLYEEFGPKRRQRDLSKELKPSIIGRRGSHASTGRQKDAARAQRRHDPGATRAQARRDQASMQRGKKHPGRRGPGTEAARPHSRPPRRDPTEGGATEPVSRLYGRF